MKFKRQVVPVHYMSNRSIFNRFFFRLNDEKIIYVCVTILQTRQAVFISHPPVFLKRWGVHQDSRVILQTFPIKSSTEQMWPCDVRWGNAVDELRKKFQSMLSCGTKGQIIKIERRSLPQLGITGARYLYRQYNNVDPQKIICQVLILMFLYDERSCSISIGNTDLIRNMNQG